MKRLAIVLLISLAGFWACSSGNPQPANDAAMVMAAGMTEVEPAGNDAVSARVDRARLDLGRVGRIYELTTPAGVPFAFDVLSLASGNAGSVRVSVAHALDGTALPAGGVESLALAGCSPTGAGLTRSELWLNAYGDGFARMSIRGEIERPQVLAFETETPVGTTTALVNLAIGPASDINTAAELGGTHPDVTSQEIIYSSDSWSFGMPTIAVSGDRTSIVVYEGDRADPFLFQRYEMRLQHDAATGLVTGGGSEEATPDGGNWRDHEVAALFNVLALARCGDQQVELQLSFDRGATFGQNETFAANNNGGFGATRLVQIGMAGDYSLAVVFWRSLSNGVAQLLLAEGRPSAFDPTGSPTAFEFDPLQVVHEEPTHVTPLLMGVAWSDGGDLVIGYAFTRFQGTGWVGQTESEFHCAVRPWTEGFRTTMVDSEVVVSRDPSLALLGSGGQMRIFYAYEVQDGIRLAVSTDAGLTFGDFEQVGSPGAHAPSVFVRAVSGAPRVDLLFLDDSRFGIELRASRWLAFGNSPREDFDLTTATMTSTALVNPQLGYGFRIRQVGWFGYDAVADGDEIVVAFDEETYDAAGICLGAPFVGPPGGGGLAAPGIANSPPNFTPAEPPPLAPGLTEPVAVPNPLHQHQLHLLRIR